MKHAAFLLALATISAIAQGPLTPPGAPAATQKSLQELWDELQDLNTSVTTQQEQIAALQSVAQRSNPILLNYANGGSLPWIITTVDSTGNVGSDTSLAFGPDGQPAISYLDARNINLNFARFNGNTWTLSTVDSGSFVGFYTSLAFGPDSQPAISYWDAGGGTLKFARFNGATWTLSTIDSAGNSFTSLAFGQDGQPAISYWDASNGDLQLARMGVFQPAP